jgi:hypothetical protein
MSLHVLDRLDVTVLFGVYIYSEVVAVLPLEVGHLSDHERRHVVIDS